MQTTSGASMGSANIYTGFWTGDRRWDLELWLRDQGHRFRWNRRTRAAMSAGECVAHFLAWLDGRSCPAGSLLGLSQDDVEHHALWRWKRGLLWAGMVRVGMIDNPGTDDVTFHDYRAFNGKRVQGRIKKWLSNGGNYRGTCPHCMAGQYAHRLTPDQSRVVPGPESGNSAACGGIVVGSGESLGGVPLVLVEATVSALSWDGSPNTVAQALMEVHRAPAGAPTPWDKILADVRGLGSEINGLRPFDAKRKILAGARQKWGCADCGTEFLTGDMANWTDSYNQKFPDERARCWNCAQVGGRTAT